MTSNLKKILTSKRAVRRQLATRPIAEKLRLLDAMRERELAIRRGHVRFRRSYGVRGGESSEMLPR